MGQWQTATGFVRYRGDMAAPARDEILALPPLARSRARQWARTAWALGLLFATAPLACRIFVGVWGFEGAGAISVLSLLLGTYLHFRGRRTSQALPDSAALLDQGLRLASAGEMDQSIAVLNKAIRLSPHLWQAFQYRGQIHALTGSFDAAIADFTEAIRLAPREQHLYSLREHAKILREGGPAAPSA